jgi:hypothetical protein
MAGLVPATHAAVSLVAGGVKPRLAPFAWMDGTSPSMTASEIALCPFDIALCSGRTAAKLL